MTAADLKASLRGLGLTQGRFASLVGVETSTVSRWATGSVEVPKYAATVLSLLQRLDDIRSLAERR